MNCARAFCFELPIEFYIAFTLNVIILKVDSYSIVFRNNFGITTICIINEVMFNLLEVYIFSFWVHL